jgi:hypothetical protein
LKNNNHDQRVGAVAILDWKARDKKVSAQEKEEAYFAYIENHEWIDDWGLVDRATPYVVGGYLFHKDRTPLYKPETVKDHNVFEKMIFLPKFVGNENYTYL